MPNTTVTNNLNEAYERYTLNPSNLEDDLLPALYSYTEEMLGIKREEQGGLMVIVSGNEDALQEAIMKVWKLLPTYDSTKAKFTTWVYRIVKSAESDQEDKERRKAPPDLLNLEALENVPSSEMAADTKYQIKEAINSLPSKEKALVERIYAGDTVEEAASELGISRATAFRRWKKAQAILRGDLE